MPGLGPIGEDLVAAEYKRLGFDILERNYIFPYGKQVGELDLVCRKGSELVFVEVKLRSNSKFGTPFESVNRSKQLKLIKMAKLYLASHHKLSSLNYRIDVAAVTIDNGQKRVIILTNAIEDFD